MTTAFCFVSENNILSNESIIKGEEKGNREVTSQAEAKEDSNQDKIVTKSTKQVKPKKPVQQKKKPAPKKPASSNKVRPPKKESQSTAPILVRSPAKAAISNQALNRVTLGYHLGSVGEWEKRNSKEVCQGGTIFYYSDN